MTSLIGKILITIFILYIMGYGVVVIKNTWTKELDWSKTLPNPFGFIHFQDNIPSLIDTAMANGDAVAFRKLQEMYKSESDQKVKAKIKSALMKIETEYTTWEFREFSDGTYQDWFNEINTAQYTSQELFELWQNEPSDWKRCYLIHMQRRLFDKNKMKHPEYLLEIARKDSHIKNIQTALWFFQRYVLNNTNLNNYDVEETEKHWKKKDNK